MIRVLISLGALAAAIALIVWNVMSLENKAPLVEAPTAQTPRYTVKNAEWTHLNTHGELEFRMTADRARAYDDHSAHFDNIVVHRFTAGQSPWQIRAPQGDIPAQEDRVRLYDAVVGDGTLSNGAVVQVTTPELWVDSKKNELYTDAKVEITTAQWRARSTGLRGDLGGEKIALLHNTQVTYAPAP